MDPILNFTDPHYDAPITERAIDALCAFLDGRAHVDDCSIEYAGGGRTVFSFRVRAHADPCEPFPPAHEMLERVSVRLAELAIRRKR